MVANDRSLCILEALDLEQREASSPLVETLWVFEHHALTFLSDYLVHQSGQLVLARTLSLLEDLTDCLWHLGNRLFAHLHAMGEVSLDERSVEDHKFNFCPLGVLSVMLAHDTDDLLKVVTIRPKLSIKGNIR